MTTAPFVPFHELVAAHAAARPQDLAFVEGEHRVDWQTLHAHAGAVARALVGAGLEPHERVAVLGHPSLGYVECLFGIVAARGCVVPLPATASVEALEIMLVDCDARFLFLDPDVEPALLRAAERLARQRSIIAVHLGPEGHEGESYAAWRAQGDNDRALPQAQPDDPFNIIYSSGTTGMPKGIVHLHGMRQRQACRGGFGFGPASRTLLATPMYSNTTITPLLGSAAHGGASVLMRRFDAGRYLATAAAEHATHTMLVPVQYKRLLAHAAFGRHDLSAFQVSQCTGAPMDVALKREILARWPGRFLEVYGMTEGGVSCFLDARQHPDKLATVGRPVHGTEVFLLDDAGRRLPDEPGLTGEVAGRSPFMMAGYHNRPDATAEIRWFGGDGGIYHRTGDIGRFDADGFLTLLDRKKDVIISGGHNVYAADLEAVLARHPDVQDSAVIGVPSEQWGETPLALVVARPGAQIDAAQLRDWVNGQVGKMQRLHAVELRSELPRSPLGKLSKKELRAPYWRAPSG